MRILINDFIGGVLDRGMPHYVRNIIDGLREEGFEVSFVRAPKFFRKIPRGVFYIVAVLFEQTVPPVLGIFRRADITLYPYNSIAVADLITGRGRIVVHDLEQLNRALSPSKLYYLACYRALKWFKRPVYTISELTRQRLIESGLFGKCPILILPVTFYAFEALIAGRTPPREDIKTLLLCTGSTANKDVEGLAANYLPKLLAAGYRITVVGLHKAGDMPRFAALSEDIAAGRLRICGRLTDAEVATEYQKHPIVWVHSLREGFGRCVVEGRLAGNRVVCSDIPEFSGMQAQMRDEPEVYLYRDSADLLAILDRLLHSTAPVRPFNGYPYREMLRNAIGHGL